jgi:hypothetical protein
MFERQRSLVKRSDIHQTHINWWVVVLVAIEGHTRTVKSILDFFLFIFPMMMMMTTAATTFGTFQY